MPWTIIQTSFFFTWARWFGTYALLTFTDIMIVLIAAISISTDSSVSCQYDIILHLAHSRGNRECPGKVAERWQPPRLSRRLLSDLRLCSQKMMSLEKLRYSVVECHSDKQLKKWLQYRVLSSSGILSESCFPSTTTFCMYYLKGELSLKFLQQIWRNFAQGIDLLYH